jgi:hypothetical protein
MRPTSHQRGRGRVISITVKLYDDISWAKLTPPTAPAVHSTHLFFREDAGLAAVSGGEALRRPVGPDPAVRITDQPQGSSLDTPPWEPAVVG